MVRLFRSTPTRTIGANTLNAWNIIFQRTTSCHPTSSAQSCSVPWEHRRTVSSVRWYRPPCWVRTGQNWLEALRLDWRTIFTIGDSRTLQSVLEQHSVVFKDELGKLQGVEAKIYVEEGARPRFEKARPVPFAIHEKVEKELRLLSTPQTRRMSQSYAYFWVWSTTMESFFQI